MSNVRLWPISDELPRASNVWNRPGSRSRRARFYWVLTLSRRTVKRADQRFHRDLPRASQPANHGQRERPLAPRDLGCTRTRTEHVGEISLGIAVGFHAISDDVDGIGLRDRPTHAFVGFDQRSEYIEAVGFGRPLLRRLVEIALDGLQRHVVIDF